MAKLIIVRIRVIKAQLCNHEKKIDSSYLVRELPHWITNKCRVCCRIYVLRGCLLASHSFRREEINTCIFFFHQ